MAPTTATNRHTVAREEPPLVFVGEVIDGRFEIEGVAGAGGMGTVYRAYDIATGRTVALKIMRAFTDKTRRFAREIRTVSDVRHKSIVGYVAHGKTRRGADYLAMEWVDGEDLSARLARGPLALLEALRVVRRVAAALATVHAAGIVHRDIKPSNIAVGAGTDGQVKLLDFGVVRSSDEDDFDAETTKPGSVVGTLSYMAPEQARGEEIDGRADLFSLGCVLYECLTGEPAFSGTNPAQIVVALHVGKTPLPSKSRAGLPPELDALVARMLAKRREDRPATAHEIVVWLDAIVKDVTSMGTLPTMRPPPVV